MSGKLHILCLCITLSLSLSFCMSQEQVKFDYSKCNEGKDSCRDCYTELVRSVFGNDDNVFNLNKAFFPTRTNPAEFVVITYHFMNESMDESFVWFWTAQSSYLIHPLHTFQFLSLFFGKPEAFYTQQADVTLNATSCWGVQDDDAHLELLTQRLKLYVQKQNIFASIDDTYSAKAVNTATLEEILTNHDKEITTIILFLQFLMIAFITSVVVIVMLVHYKWPKRLQKLSKFNKYLKQKQAVILSVALISFLSIWYIIALDSTAINRRDEPFTTDVSKIHFSKIDLKNIKKSKPFDPFTLLYNLPGIVLMFDLIGCIISIIMLFLGAFSLCFDLRTRYCMCNVFAFLCVSALGLIFSVINHSPFIAIAYLNDAYHAGSIFIYYTVITLILFAVIERIIVSCLSNFKKEIQLQDSEWKFNSGEIHIKSGDNELAMSLCESSVIKVSKGKVEMKNAYDPIEPGVVLEIASGELKFKPEQQSQESEFLTRLSQTQTPQNLTLAAQRPLPKARVKLRDDEPIQHFLFSGLKPAENQALMVDRCTETQGNNNFTVTLSKTELNLEQIGEFHNIFCVSKRCGSYPSEAWIGAIVVAIVLLILFILGIVAVLTSYFVIIPINRSISDAPNRLIGIYESAIVLVGAYIAYKAFFKTKKYLESSVVKRENPLTLESKDKWKDMSDEEKLAEFYSAVVDIIADKKSKCQESKEDERKDVTGSHNGGEADECDGTGGQHDNIEHVTRSSGGATNGRPDEGLEDIISIEGDSQAGRKDTSTSTVTPTIEVNVVPAPPTVSTSDSPAPGAHPHKAPDT